MTIPQSQSNLLLAFASGKVPGGAEFPDAWREFITTTQYKLNSASSTAREVNLVAGIRPRAIFSIRQHNLGLPNLYMQHGISLTFSFTSSVASRLVVTAAFTTPVQSADSIVIFPALHKVINNYTKITAGGIVFATSNYEDADDHRFHNYVIFAR